MTPVPAARSRHARITLTSWLIATMAVVLIGLAAPAETHAATACVTFKGDATGSRDVTSSLTSFIRAHNGKVICLKARGHYRVDGIVRLTSLYGVRLDGRGATLKPTSTSAAGTNRRQLYILSSGNLIIKNLHIAGLNPNVAQWHADREQEPGIWIDGGANIKIQNVTIRNTYGDGIKLGFRNGVVAPPSKITLDRVTIRGVGRNGIAIVSGHNILITRTTISDTGLHGIDLEPDLAGADIHHVTVQSSTIKRIGRAGVDTSYSFAANGNAGSMHDISVLNNTGDRFQTTVQAKPGQTHRTIVFRGNRSITVAQAYFGNIVGLSSSGNNNISVHTSNVR